MKWLWVQAYSREEPGRIEEVKAHGTVPCRAEENMPIV